MKEERPEEMVRADKALKFFKNAREGTYPVDESQRELIRRWWWELHNYDKQGEYTISEDGKHIRKNIRNRNGK